MDYKAINDRWIYKLALETFVSHFWVFLMLAAVLQLIDLLPLWINSSSALLFPSFMASAFFPLIVHRSILIGKKEATANVFNKSPVFWPFFWRYIAVILFTAGVLFGFILFLGPIVQSSGGLRELTLLISLGFGAILYALMLSIFGTGMPAAAIGADKKMSIERGKLVFRYSFGRLLVLNLPLFCLLILVIGLGMTVQMPNEILDKNMNFSLITLFFGLLVQFVFIGIGIVASTIITKAFLKAELALVVAGTPTEWAENNIIGKENG